MDQIVPVSSAPNQSLAVALNVDSRIVALRLYVWFCEMAQYWLMRISDANGVVLIDSMPLVTGSYPAANLLAQHGYLAIGSAYLINASGISDDLPTAHNLGSDFLLLWGDAA